MNARLRVVIADDEPLARQRLRTLLGRHADLEIVGECGNGPQVLSAVRELRPDVLFLDVQMPGMTGLEALAALGEGATPVVVFVTAYDAHAIDAFAHHALDYVLKPIDEERFERALHRVRRRVEEQASGAFAKEVMQRLAGTVSALPAAEDSAGRPDRFLLRDGARVRFVAVEDVDWIEADGDYVRLHTGRTSHLLRSTLSAIEAQIDPAVFVRIHRSTIVRIARIQELEACFRGEYRVVLATGAKLKMSRTYRDRLEAALRQQL